jgi:hypothetical protein
MDYISPGPYTLICLSWVALPGAYAPASIALRVIGARKPPLHDKAVVLEEQLTDYLVNFPIQKIAWISFLLDSSWDIQVVDDDFVKSDSINEKMMNRLGFN